MSFSAACLKPCLYLNDCFGIRYPHFLIDELQGKLNLPRGPSRFADHSKPRAFDRVRRQAHVHHVEHIEELPTELKVGTLQTTASMGNRRCLDDGKIEVVISRTAETIPSEIPEPPGLSSGPPLYPEGIQ